MGTELNTNEERERVGCTEERERVGCTEERERVGCTKRIFGKIIPLL